MAEIRQIQVDGVNYDLVISEDEVSATAAAQSAAQALAYKNQAQSSAAQAGQQATNASNQADRAEDAASRAEAIVGGQFVSYGQNQALNDTQKEQARANIKAGGSNRNLLDNPFFTVNQRNVSGTITSGYIADRWTITYGSGGVQASRTEDTVTVKSTSGSSHGDIVQKMEKSLFDFLVGKTVTASVMRSNGSVISKSFTFQSAVSSVNVGTDLDGNLISVRVYQTSTYQDVQFWKWNTAATIRAVKLEIGSVSTLANDAPPDYGTELAKCQRYFYRVKGNSSNYAPFGIGMALTTSSAAILIPTQVTMRGSITVSTSGSFGLLSGGSSHTGISSIAYYDNTGGNVRVNVNLSSSPLTNGALCYLQASGNASAYIDLSADL